MGFGKKSDFETGRVLDLDQSYKNLIKPAVEATALKCIRADEIVHSGLIDVPMYEQLLKQTWWWPTCPLRTEMLSMSSESAMPCALIPRL